jgi:FAD/FMN-containing dehydrogenase
LWAVRGAGPEFFGIVTSYHVRLQTAPKAIMTSVRVYPPSDAQKVGEWAEVAMTSAPANLEFTVKISAPPPEANAPVGAYVLAVIGTAFAASERDAGQILDALFASAPEGAVETVDLIPTPFNALYELTSVSTPKGKRYAVDTLWSDASFVEILDMMVAGYGARPSMESFALLALRSPLSVAPGDAAFSRIGRVFSSIYTVWDGEENDKANMGWLRRTMMEIEPLANGTYVGESDLEREDRPVGIHSPEVALKISALKAKYDPRRIFRSLVAETTRTSAA